MLRLAVAEKKQLPGWPLSLLQRRAQHPTVLVWSDALWLMLRPTLAQHQCPHVLSHQLAAPGSHRALRWTETGSLPHLEARYHQLTGWQHLASLRDSTSGFHWVPISLLNLCFSKEKDSLTCFSWQAAHCDSQHHQIDVISVRLAQHWL